jgi:hypothetical protein
VNTGAIFGVVNVVESRNGLHGGVGYNFPRVCVCVLCMVVQDDLTKPVGVVIK